MITGSYGESSLLHWCQEWDPMAQPLDIPLPELVAEDFSRGWMRFELVAKTKGWDEAKQLTILPTLLRGKLLDYYFDVDEETKGGLKQLKTALMKTAGLVEDPLIAAKEFVARNQGADEKVADFAAALTKLFRKAYPTEALTSSVLLQRFLTGLRAPISQQLLLRKRPDEFRRAVDDATEVEYALNFDGTCRDRSQREVNTMRDQQPQPADSSHPTRPDEKLSQLQHALDEMTKRMESLELMLKTKQEAETRPPGRGGRRPATAGFQGTRDRMRGRWTCYRCGQEGHIKRNCPLNFAGPAQTAGSWP